MPKQLSPDELARRKKLQAGLSVAGGTLGLAALGAKGGSYALKRAGKSAGSTNVERVTTGLLASGAGIGGVGSFNFASTQRAEAAGVRPKTTIKKNDIYAPNEAAAAKIKAARPDANVIIGSPPKKKSAETREQRIARQAAQERQAARRGALVLSDKAPKAKKPSMIYRIAGKKIPGGRIGAGIALAGLGAGAGYLSGKLSKRDETPKVVAYSAGATYGAYLGGGYALSHATKSSAFKDKKSNEAMGRHRKAMGLPEGPLAGRVPKKKIEQFYRTTPQEVRFSGTKRLLARTHGVSGFGRMGLPVIVAGAAGGYMYDKGKISKSNRKENTRNAGIAAAGAGLYAASQTSGIENKTAMRESAKTNYSMNRQIGNNKVASALKTAKAQLKANPGNMPNFKPAESPIDLAARKLDIPGAAENSEKRRMKIKSQMRGIKGFGVKYYAKGPLLVGGAATVAGASMLKDKKAKTVSKAFDPEQRRLRRADIYTGAAIAGSAGLGAKSVKDLSNNRAFRGHTRQAGRNISHARSFVGYRNEYMRESRAYANKAKTAGSKSAATAASNKAANAKIAAKANLAEGKKFGRMAGKHIYSAGKIVAGHKPVIAALALAGAAPAIQYQKKNSGRTYTTWYDGKKAPQRRFSRVDNTTASSS